MIDLAEKKKEFLDIAKQDIQRQGIDGLLSWLVKTDFFEAPASTRYHDSEPGGLLNHSLSVYYNILFLDKMYGTNYPRESLAIVSLFHDLCKIGCYTVSSRNVKDDKTGLWHKEPFYKWEEQQRYGGHGSKSVFIVQTYLQPLYFEEAAAINCHMGVDDSGLSVYDVYRDNVLAFLLHFADTASTIPDINSIVMSDHLSDEQITTNNSDENN